VSSHVLLLFVDKFDLPLVTLIGLLDLSLFPDYFLLLGIHTSLQSSEGLLEGADLYFVVIDFT